MSSGATVRQSGFVLDDGASGGEFGLAHASPIEDRPRILSHDECRMVAKRVMAAAVGGGEIQVVIRHTYDTRLFWQRNRPVSATITIVPSLVITQVRRAEPFWITPPEWDDVTVQRAMQAANRALPPSSGSPATDAPWMASPETFITAPLHDTATVAMSAAELSDIARATADTVAARRFSAAGGVGIRTTTQALINSRGVDAYATTTGTYFSQSVRDPVTDGVGWAGERQSAWSAMSVTQLTNVAIERCQSTANPRAVEPGRYTTVLAPLAVEGILGFLTQQLERQRAESNETVFADPQRRGTARFGQRVMDERVTLLSDPSDTERGYVPFDADGFAHRKATWITNGILTELPYGREYANTLVARGTVSTTAPLANPMTFRMTGGTATLEQLIASTERGIFVPGFSMVTPLSGGGDPDFAVTGTTRHGLWLIDQGKLSCAVKPMRFVERPMHVMNRVMGIGRTERSFGMTFADDLSLDGFAFSATGVAKPEELPTLLPRWGHPLMFLPTLQIRDFNFVSLADAV